MVEIQLTWLASQKNVDLAKKWFPLVLLMRSSYKEVNFSVPDELAEAIKLTGEGDFYLNEILSRHAEADENASKLAVFLFLCHDGLLVDLENSDYEAIRRYWAELVLTSKVRYPETLGRTLYNRFFSIEALRSVGERMTSDQVKMLLEGVGNFPYQAHSLVFGPLGWSHSDSSRRVLMQWEPILWSCSDTGCSHLHRSYLKDASEMWMTHWNYLTFAISESSSSVASSDWEKAFYDLFRGYYYQEAMTDSLLEFLIEVLSEDEIQTVFQFFAEGLQHLGEVESFLERHFESSDTGLLKSKDYKTQLQILMSLSDDLLASIVDQVVADGLIAVPASELRFSRMYASSPTGFWRLEPLISRRGLTFSSSNPELRMLRLESLLFSTIGKDDPETLAWLLRDFEQDTLERTVRVAVHEETPRALLRRVILHSPKNVRLAQEALLPGVKYSNRGMLDEDVLVTRILWRLGFVEDASEDGNEQLMALVEDLNQTISGIEGEISPRNEAEIRGRASNLFVEFESVIDRVIAFTGWALLKQQVRQIEGERLEFGFELNTARRHLETVLDSSVRYQSDGSNTIGTLIFALRNLSEVLSQMLKDGSRKFEFTSADLPHQSMTGHYPFDHLLPFFDLAEQSQKSIIRSLEESATKLHEANLANVRNRIEHHNSGSGFPDRDSLQKTLRAIKECFEIWESSGMIPYQYRVMKVEFDEYRRWCAQLRSPSGAVTYTHGPSSTDLTNMPDGDRPHIPFKAARLKKANDSLRFRLVERSEYWKMWKDFPLRRVQVDGALLLDYREADDNNLI
jgi:hypothetical protein